MVPEVAAAMSERPTATSEHRVTGRTDALCTGSSDAYAENWQRLVTALLSWWPIYTPHPGHFEFAGVPRHLIHTQEHLRAIQELIDHILRF